MPTVRPETGSSPDRAHSSEGRREAPLTGYYRKGPVAAGSAGRLPGSAGDGGLFSAVMPTKPIVATRVVMKESIFRQTGLKKDDMVA